MSPRVSPTMSPTNSPISPPVAALTSFPSIRKTSQPTGRPTNVFPKNAYTSISFSASHTLIGLNSSSFRSPIARKDFRIAVSKSMSGVRLRDVAIVRVTNVTATTRVILDTVHQYKGTFRSEAVVSSARVIWNVSINLAATFTTDPAAAYSALSATALNSSVSGSFLTLLKSSKSALAAVQSSIFALVGSYTTVTVTAPAGSPSLSINPSVSKIRVVNATGTNVTLSVLLIKNTVGRGDSNGGTLYCAAILNGNNITSTGSVVSAQYDGTSSKGASITIPATAIYPLNLMMTISGMAALQVYAVYCYVQPLSGTGNSLAEVISTKTYAYMTC